MPVTNQPQHGIQGFWAKFQALTQRVTNLETWQRTLEVLQLPAGHPWVLDGPHDLSFPSISSGASNTQSLSAALRNPWTEGVVLGQVSGAFLLPQYSYSGGTTWTVTLANPWTFTQPASGFRCWVLGY